MAEKSCSRVERDLVPEKVNVKSTVQLSISSAVPSVSTAVSSVLSAVPSVSSVVPSIVPPVVSSVPVLHDSSSDEDVDERGRLLQHQKNLSRKGKRSYASAAAALDSSVFNVSFPDSYSNFGRPRPRTVFVHGLRNPRIIAEKLAKSDIVPLQVQSLLNSDIAITFSSVADKQKFLNLDYVVSSVSSAQSPVWVRVHFKPAELKASVVKERLSQFGSVIFFRENRLVGTAILSGSLTAKMILRNPIPSFLHFGPVCLAVNYDGQSPTCRKCDSSGHIAKVCQIKRCFNCGKTGHLNRQCPEPLKCQGCSSEDHCFEQCPVCWEQEEQEEQPVPDHNVFLEVQDSSVPELGRLDWGDAVEGSAQGDTVPVSVGNSTAGSDPCKDYPVDSHIWSPLLAERMGESSAESLSRGGESQSDGSLVIDETVPVDEPINLTLKRSRDTDEASFKTVSRRRPTKKKIKDSS